MQKISTMRTNAKNIFEGQLTIGLDLGDRSSAYCVLNEVGEIVLEHRLATTPEAMKQVFGSMPRCRIAMETGTHSPWVSRLAERKRLWNEKIVEKSKKLLTGIGLLMEGVKDVLAMFEEISPFLAKYKSFVAAQ